MNSPPGFLVPKPGRLGQYRGGWVSFNAMSANPPLGSIELGARVTLRSRHPEGGYSDTVGEFQGLTDDAEKPVCAIVLTKRGRREVPVDSIVIAHLVKAPPKST